MIEKEFETFAINRSFVNLENPQEPDVKTKYLLSSYFMYRWLVIIKTFTCFHEKSFVIFVVIFTHETNSYENSNSIKIYLLIIKFTICYFNLILWTIVSTSDLSSLFNISYSRIIFKIF